MTEKERYGKLKSECIVISNPKLFPGLNKIKCTILRMPVKPKVLAINGTS